MKNLLKLFVVIAFVAVIGFFLAACDDGGNGGGNDIKNGNGHENGNGNGNENGNGNVNGNENGNGNQNGGNTVTKPSVPTGVTANTLSSTTIRVSWSAVSRATSYKVYYSSYSGQENPGLTSTVTTTFYEHTSCVSDSTYYYKVAAVNSAGEGTASSIVSAKTNKFGTPGIPTGVSATALSSSSIRISWSSPSGYSYESPAGYNIYRSTSASGSFPYLDYTSNLSYTDTGLNASTTYYYRVKAINDKGDGSSSSTVSATTTASSGGGGGSGGGTTNAPSVPTGVTASRNPAGSTTVRVSWNAVSGATSYKVYYSSTGSGSGTLDGTSTTTSYDSTGYSTTSTWYFRVSAVNSAGEGAPSSWVSVGPVTGGSGGYGTVKVENGGTSSIGAIYLLLVGTGGSGNTIENSSSTTNAGVTRTYSLVPAGQTYKVSIMIGTNVYQSNTFTLSPNETVNVMWTGLNLIVY